MWQFTLLSSALYVSSSELLWATSSESKPPMCSLGQGGISRLLGKEARVRGTDCSINRPSVYPVFHSTLLSEVSRISNSCVSLEIHDPKSACFILIFLSSLGFQHFVPHKSVTMQLSFLSSKNINILKIFTFLT